MVFVKKGQIAQQRKYHKTDFGWFHIWQFSFNIEQKEAEYC
jgi:hypothetical protein